MGQFDEDGIARRIVAAIRAINKVHPAMWFCPGYPAVKTTVLVPRGIQLNALSQSRSVEKSVLILNDVVLISQP
ncbi:hypothetical protein [Tistrella mobilis]|uniref:hypothetical protein n=1 Tax=Tistrella mobilis TaxID=171437 RepID=UPI0035572DA2